MSAGTETWQEGLHSPAPESVTPSLEKGQRTAKLSLMHLLRKAVMVWEWLRRQKSLAGKNRRLRVAETVSLGDKRFVSLIEVDGQSLLIGGGTNGISLLTTLPSLEVAKPIPAVAAPEHGVSAEAFEQVLGRALKETT